MDTHHKVLLLTKHLLNKVNHLNKLLPSLNQNSSQDFAKKTVLALINLTPSEPLFEQLTHSLKALSQALEHNDFTLISNQLMYLQAEIIHLAQQHHDTLKLIIIGLKTPPLSQEIMLQMKYFNYHCLAITHLEQITALCHYPIHTIILNLEDCGDQDLTTLQNLSAQFPILFISNEQDITHRLFAAKVGGCFLPQPIEFLSLLEKIEQNLTSTKESPYRILIVEDSPTQAKVISQYLEQSALLTRILTHPLHINEALTEFQPDLILLDLYLPHCSGIELAKIIRQQDLFVNVPIVYLSAEQNLTQQLQAIQQGGDDFLIKPIAPHPLLAIVKARAHRSRMLRASMILDSLTGFLNHTRLLEQLNLEIERAQRTHTLLSFAMLDLDHFKTINDRYGHPIGDKVIKALAQLLKQHLRKTDSIGRYGGEEFALILPQADSQSVFKKLDEIRQKFSQLVHHAAFDATFSVTLSGGIAQLSESLHSVDSLVEAADQALYQAKQQGRNRII